MLRCVRETRVLRMISVLTALGLATRTRTHAAPVALAHAPSDTLTHGRGVGRSEYQRALLKNHTHTRSALYRTHTRTNTIVASCPTRSYYYAAYRRDRKGPHADAPRHIAYSARHMAVPRNDQHSFSSAHTPVSRVPFAERILWRGCDHHALSL